MPDSSPKEAAPMFHGGCRIEWQCLDCGDHGIRKAGYEYDVERAVKSVSSWHNLTNPGCRGTPDSIRVREDSDDDRDARLRAG